MEEFCGYKSLDGSLHANRESCLKADKAFQLKKFKDQVEKLGYFMDERLNKIGNEVLPINHSINSHLSKREIDELRLSIRKSIRTVLLELFVSNQKDIEQIWKDSKILAKELNDEMSKFKQEQPWWLKLKWW